MSRMTRLKSCTALFASFLIVFGHSPAMAQASYDRGGNESVAERPRPDYDPLGWRFGGFTVSPTVDVGATHTDNLFASETNTQSDLITFVRPAVTVSSNWSRHSVVADANIENVSHQDFSSEDATNSSLGLAGRVDVRRTTQIGGALRYSQTAEARSAPDSPTIAGEPVDIKTKSARVYVQQQFNRLRLSASADQADIDYEDVSDGMGGVIDQDVRDHQTRVLTARGEYAISPRVAVLGQASFGETEYDTTGVARDSEERTYLIGANFDLTRLARGEVAVGYFDREWSGSTAGSSSGLAVQANVDWFPTELTTVAFSASRNTEDSWLGLAESYVSTRTGVRVDHELLRNVILSGGLEGTRREYSGIERDDDVLTADLGVRYLMNRRLVLGGGYRYEESTSNGADRDRDFDINRFFLSLGLRI